MSSARDYGGTVCYIVTVFNLTETGEGLITVRPDLADYSPAGYFHHIAGIARPASCAKIIHTARLWQNNN